MMLLLKPRADKQLARKWAESNLIWSIGGGGGGG